MRSIGANLLAALGLLLLPAAAAAEDPVEPAHPVNLRVTNSEGAWQADAFQLHWDQVPAEPEHEVVSVEYRLYDGAGEPLGPVGARAWLGSKMALAIADPGTYRLELWLRDSIGRTGPSDWVTLRYDDGAPAPPSPQAPVEWISAQGPALLRIGHPAAPLPLSGIRGYAISTDRGGGSAPCATADRCTFAETDLDGGIDDDAISLGRLPEGSTAVRVVAVSGAGVASPPATATFRVDANPPTVRLEGVPAGWASGPVRVEAKAADALSGMAAAGPAGPFTALAVDGAPALTAPGDRALATVAGSGVHRIAYFARDAAGNATDGAAGAPQPETAVVRIDEEDPSVQFTANQDPQEPERIEALVEDDLSGASPRKGQIYIREVGSKSAFQALPTTVAMGQLRAFWDSDSFPLGKYEFRATGFDAAGNTASGSSRARGGRMILVNPVKTPTAIELGFRDKRRRWRLASSTVAYGTGARFGGRLRTETGAPVAGREVTITELLADGSRSSRRTTFVRTDSDGAFSAWLPPGPSREVVASFGGSHVLTRASGSALHLRVRAGVRLRASSAEANVGGPAVVFSGKVGPRGALLPQEGRPVELQFRYPGAGWSEFRTVQTDSRGRFHYAYVFSDDDSRGVRFQFRAYVAAEEGWPYEPAYSRPVAVTGR